MVLPKWERVLHPDVHVWQISYVMQLMNENILMVKMQSFVLGDVEYNPTFGQGSALSKA